MIYCLVFWLENKQRNIPLPFLFLLHQNNLTLFYKSIVETLYWSSARSFKGRLVKAIYTTTCHFNNISLAGVYMVPAVSQFPCLLDHICCFSCIFSAQDFAEVPKGSNKQIKNHFIITSWLGSHFSRVF